MKKLFIKFIGHNEINQPVKLGLFWNIVLIVGLVVCFLTMEYSDIIITSNFGVVFLDSIFDGRLFSFYDNAALANVTPEGAVYDIGIYIIFGIWSIPVWLLKTFAGISVNAVGCLLWYKLLPIFFLFLDIKVLEKIARKLSLSDIAVASIRYLLVLSPISFFPVFVAIQYDVIILFFILMGIYGILKGSWKQYLIWFGLALTLKPFAAFILVCGILFYEKRIVGIIWKTFVAVVPLAICKLVYASSAAFQSQNTDFLTGKMHRLFSSVLPSGQTGIPMFIMILAIIWIIAYFCKNHDCLVANSRMFIMLGCGVWGAFCIFADIFPYWSVYLAPFLVLTILMNEKNLEKLLMVSFAGEVAYTFVLVAGFDWVYGGGNTYQYLTLKKVFLKFYYGSSSISVHEFFCQFDSYMPALYAMAAACFIMVWGYTIYCEIKGNESVCEVHDGEICVFENQIKLRILFVWAWIALSFMAFISSDAFMESIIRKLWL